MGKRGFSGLEQIFSGAVIATLAAVAVVWLGGAASVSATGLSGTVRCKGTRDCADAVVYVAAVPGKSFAPPKEPVSMDQKGMEFVPKVLPVLVGTTVNFLNSDAVLHNVFTPDACADKFNLGTWPKGEVRSFTFKKECAAALLCNPHPEMSGYVVAVPTPYFAVTDKAGKWSLPDVPAGELMLKVWHPRLKGTSRVVKVPADGAIDFDIAR